RHHVEYYATDLAGIVEPFHALDVSIDITPPTAVAAIAGTLGSNEWYVSNVTVSLNASDAMSGVASLAYRVDGLGWTTYSGAFVLPDGRHLIEYLAADVAGLSGPIQSLVVAVDTTPPTTVAALSGQEGSNGWFVSNVTVFLNATDALSGLANLSYRIDNGSWQTYSAPFLLAEGLHQVDFLAIDLAGNVEALQSLNLAIDTTPPTSSAIVSGTLGLNGWYVSNATISLSAIDATSGIARIVYRIDGGVWTNYSGFFVVSEGTHTIDFVAIDSTPPTTSASVSGSVGSNGWFVSNATVSLNASDSLSGVAAISYLIDAGSWKDYSRPFLVSEGTHTIEFFATDMAGNEEAI